MIEFFMEFEPTEDEVLMLKAHINSDNDIKDGSMNIESFREMMNCSVVATKLYNEDLMKTAKGSISKIGVDKGEAKLALSKVKQMLNLKNFKIINELQKNFMSSWEE